MSTGVQREAWREQVEENRDALEAIANSDLDLQLVDDVQKLLEEADNQ